MDLSIIIGSYNTINLLEKNLRSLLPCLKGIKSEIIIIDCSSTDGTLDMLKNNFPHIRTVQTPKQGYSKAYNLGTLLSQGKVILHLNSDIIFSPNFSFAQLINLMQKDPMAGIAGCKILRLNGSLERPCKRSLPTFTNIFFQTTGLANLFPRSSLFANYYLGHLDFNKTHNVECIMGAFMLIKRDIFKKVGLFEEMEQITGKKPVATMDLQATRVQERDYQQTLQEYISKIK